MAESKYKTKWYDSPNGGVIMRVHFRLWLARPSNELGTLSIKGFDNERDAINYANSEV